MSRRSPRWLLNEIREVLDSRGSFAFRAGIVTGLPVAIAFAMGNTRLGLLTFIGSFGVQYGVGQPGRIRIQIQIWTVISLLLCTSAGILSAHHMVLTAIVLIIVAVTSVFIVNVWRIGPPGGIFMVLATGMANQLAADGVNPFLLLLMTLISSSFGAFMAVIDVFWHSHKVEQRALRRADLAVKRFEEHSRFRGGTEVQAEAAEALYEAWTFVCDSLPEEAGAQADEDAAQLREIHIRYLKRSAEMAAMELPAEISHRVSPAYTATQQDVQNRRLRDLSLGRPSGTKLLIASLQWPSEPLLIAFRVGIGATLATVMNMGIGFGRAYWAVAFVVVLLNNGGTRKEQSKKAIRRMIGMFVGIGLFWLITSFPLPPLALAWWLFLLRFIGSSLVMRAYHMAMSFLTPMALLMVAGSMENLRGPEIHELLVQRLADDIIAIVLSMVVIWVSFRGQEIMFIRGYARRTVHALIEVLDDLALERANTIHALQHRRVLYTELIANEAIARRTCEDDPAGAGQYRGMSLELQALGYLVLGACWHPDLIKHTERYKIAGTYLSHIVDQPFNQPKSPAELTVQIVDAHLAVITDPEEHVPMSPVNLQHYEAKKANEPEGVH